MAIDITRIPAIMRANKWPTGATLLDHWFSRKPAVAPSYGPPDLDTIKMDWVLGFKRARAVYDQMFAQRIWTNDKAKAQLRSVLRRTSSRSLSQRSFGPFAAAVPTLDADSINFRSVGFGPWDDDDLAMALGRFTLKLLVSGRLRMQGDTQLEVTIDEVGVYVRDQFDFDGDQDLGYWDPKGNGFSMWNPLAGSAVSNQTFRDWRSANSMGGDYLIYSDLKRTPLRKPDVFILSR